MAKAKVAASRRRPYEYDHHYGVTLRDGNARKASRGNGTSSRPAKSKTRVSMKKR